MPSTLKIIVLTLITCWPRFSLPAAADTDDSSTIDGRATVEVRSDVGWIGSGQNFNIIVAISPEKDWHVYWKNPGASGAPTEIEVTAPRGFKVGEPIFPRPTIIQTGDGPTYGYNELVAIFIPVTAPLVFEEDAATFEIATKWLACNKSCVLGEHKKALVLSTNTKSDGPRHKDMRLSQWQKRLPLAFDDLKEGSCRVEGKSLIISGWSGDQVVSFIGLERLGIQFKNHPLSTITDGHFNLTIPLTVDFSATDTETIEVEGLLLIGRNSNDPSYVVRVNAKSQN